MRILHIADLHLGAKNSKLLKEKQDILKDEMLENCHFLFSTIATGYDVVVICGDLFHSKNVSVKMVDTFFSYVRDFAKPVLYVNGNHDEKLIFPSLPENFIVLDYEKSFFETQDSVFYCAKHLQDIDNSKNTILLLHGNIESSKDNDYIDISPYLEKKFDYIALGHIHKVKKYKKGNCIFAYSGSLFSNGFDECGDKGYVEVEINNKKLEKCEFRALEQRNYVICEYDISNCKSNAEIAQGVKQQIFSLGKSEKNIFRVVLNGSYDESLNKSLALLQDYFQEYFYIEFIDNSKLKIDIESLKKETLSVKNEFISLVEGAEIDETTKQKVINLGIEALKGEDLSL